MMAGITDSNSFFLLREAINNSVKLRNEIYQLKDGSWDRLWAAMDALEDAQIAIDDFEKSQTISYLQLYGLLQAFVVQQDAVNHIRQTTTGSAKISWKADEPKLWAIRDLRNETVGHPADIRTEVGTVYCNIDRHSITSKGFRYLIWDQAGGHSKESNLIETIATQASEINKIVQETITMIQSNDQQFIEQFADEKLMDTFGQISHYQFEKLYLHESNADYAKSMFSSIRKVYKTLRTGLEKRYGSFDSTINAPGLKITIDEIDQLIDRIGQKFDASIPDSFDFAVYAESLENKWKELGEMIKEADERFSK